MIVSKTGLGSSAAMTTSIVGAVLEFFHVTHLQKHTTVDKQYIHNISQVSHCLAQGKVGSGFDVSSAVYGTQVYNRFTPAIVDTCLQHYAVNTTITNSNTANAKAFSHSFYQLVTAVDEPEVVDGDDGVEHSVGTREGAELLRWDQEIVASHLPPGVDLLMGDVHGGTNTPAMVSHF